MRAVRPEPGDEVIITDMEHHSNIVPWQLMRDERGLVLKYVSCTDDGEFRIEDLAKLITPKTKLISLTHVSNVMGTVVPIKEVAKLAHEHGAKLMVDGAQAVMHMPVDVQDLDMTFMPLPDTKFTARPALVFSTARRSFWMPCRPFLAVAI